jgi:hypothetical protein
MSNEKNIFVVEIYTLLIKSANNKTENKDNCTNKDAERPIHIV